MTQVLSTTAANPDVVGDSPAFRSRPSALQFLIGLVVLAVVVQTLFVVHARPQDLVSGVSGMADLLARAMPPAVERFDETVMPVLSGGNLDMTTLQAILVHALTHRRQVLQLRVLIDDQPGKMAELSGVIAEHGANIHTVRHDRALMDLDVGEAYLTFQVETSGAGHADDIVAAIAEHGYEVDVVASGRPGRGP